MPIYLLLLLLIIITNITNGNITLKYPQRTKDLISIQIPSLGPLTERALWLAEIVQGLHIYSSSSGW